MDADLLNNVVMSALAEEVLSMRIEKALFLAEVMEGMGFTEKRAQARDLQRMTEDHDFRRNLGYKEVVTRQSDGTTYFLKDYRPAHIFERTYTKAFEEKTIKAVRLIREILAYAVSIAREEQVSMT